MHQKPPGHRCHGCGCTTETLPWQLFCDPCWRQLDPEIRTTIACEAPPGLEWRLAPEHWLTAVVLAMTSTAITYVGTHGKTGKTLAEVAAQKRRITAILAYARNRPLMHAWAHGRPT